MKKSISMLCIVALLVTILVQPAAATYQPDLPSLYSTYNDYFMFGSFDGMNNFFGGGDRQSMLQHHYNSWSPANEFKPDYLFGTSQSSSAYTTAVNATYSTTTEKAIAVDLANKTVLLNSTTSQENFLQKVRDYNATRDAKDKVKIKAHTLLWHNMTPEAFFHDGFSTSNAWASRDVMLARIDSYIKAVFNKFAPYKDVIYSWDVVNEAIDDFTGFIRNDKDYQVGNWGRIFKRPDLTGEERLLSESEFVRQAFASASKYDHELGLNWTLVYNDFYDADKPYEPKRSASVKMLTPIYEQMKKDGTTFVIGMQNRNATSLDLQVFKDTYNMFAAICDQIQFTESDTRSDLVANPNYDPNALPYYTTDGSVNVNWTKAKWDATPNAHVANVADGWQASWANQEQYQKAQADWQADQFDFLIENSKVNGGKIVMYAFDGTSDTNTFNNNKGAHIFMSADSNGNTNYTAKMSFYAMIGSAARFELKKALTNVPTDDKKSLYTTDSWNTLTAAKTAASSILNVRIYDLAAVNNVKNANKALTDALNSLTLNSLALKEIKVNGTALANFAQGTHEYNIKTPVGAVPQVAATANDASATVSVAQAQALPGNAVITVTNGSKNTTYTLNFKLDATLKSLNVNNTLISGFDPNTFTYNMTVPFGSKPVVTATTNDLGATVKITPVTSVPAQAKIDVTAGAISLTYVVNFNVDSRLKSLSIDGMNLDKFNSDNYAYNIIVPADMTKVPQINGVQNDSNAPISVVQATAVPGQAKITVGTGASQSVYTVNFSKNPNGDDEFNSNKLNTSLWHWVNEDPTTWSLTTTPGCMVISPRAGDLYQTSTDAKNNLLQDAPGDWTVESKLAFSIKPHASYQQGGIIIYQDMDNYIKLGWEAGGSNTSIQDCREVAGTPTSKSTSGNVVTNNTIWFRMVKSGTTYTSYYSVDGTNFTQINTGTMNLSNTQAGIYANNGSGTNTDLNVAFDYFHNSAVIGIPYPVSNNQYAFAIQNNGVLDRTNGIAATVNVAPVQGSTAHQGQEVVVFELMKGDTPVSIVALEKDIVSQEKFTGFFNVNPSDNTYTVKVFVLDSFNSTATAPISLAQSAVLH